MLKMLSKTRPEIKLGVYSASTGGKNVTKIFQKQRPKEIHKVNRMYSSNFLILILYRTSRDSEFINQGNRINQRNNY